MQGIRSHIEKILEILFIYLLYSIINPRQRYLLQNRPYSKVVLTARTLIRERVIERQNNTFENICVYFETRLARWSAIIKGYPKIPGPLRVTLKTGANVDRISHGSFSLYLPLFLQCLSRQLFYPFIRHSLSTGLISFDRIYLVRHHERFVSFLDQGPLNFERVLSPTHYCGD